MSLVPVIVYLFGAGATVVLLFELAFIELKPLPSNDSIMRRTRAEAELQLLGELLSAFQSQAGRYPTQSEGLQALVHWPATLPPEVKYRSLLTKIPSDPWQRPYQYRATAERPMMFRLFSLGPDGTESADDIYHHTLPKSSS